LKYSQNALQYAKRITTVLAKSVALLFISAKRPPNARFHTVLAAGAALTGQQ
jgi:hypothetical protein